MVTRDKFLVFNDKKKRKRKKKIINAILCHVWKNGNNSGKPQVKPWATSQVSFSLYLDKGGTPVCLKLQQNPRFLWLCSGLSKIAPSPFLTPLNFPSFTSQYHSHYSPSPGSQTACSPKEHLRAELVGRRQASLRSQLDVLLTSQGWRKKPGPLLRKGAFSPREAAAVLQSKLSRHRESPFTVCLYFLLDS